MMSLTRAIVCPPARVLGHSWKLERFGPPDIACVASLCFTRDGAFVPYKLVRSATLIPEHQTSTRSSDL